MEPLASGLDILQGEETMYMGYLLPTIYSIQEHLNLFKNNNQLESCLPLLEAILEGINKRYSR